MNQPHLPAIASRCKLLVFDFDGVFTDNYVYVDQDGREMVRCSRSDTFGLAELRTQGVDVLIMSTETNGIVSRRAEKIGIPAKTGIQDKGVALTEELHQRRLSAEEVVYVGNDINDLPAFAVAGVAIAVADAYPTVREQADYVTEACGGNGAVREVIALLLTAKQ